MLFSEFFKKLSQDFTQLLESEYEFSKCEQENNVIEIKLPNVSAEIFNIIISGVISLESYDASAIFDLLVIINEFMFPELVDHFQHILIDNNAYGFV
ncbi:hypothetical protein C2G38_2159406 [Gigaspora rosea]|uniref:BTB domain-containing protein n=1 Tax=Gigaspora rosea TaxID=44941 RepID=A0A397W6I1_9GLOM|nr:hypothetical protein C2G38_2159406 [Gigaspora rosea]